MQTIFSPRKRFGTLALLSATSLAIAADDGYMNHKALSESMQTLAGKFESCSVDSIGTSRQGRDLFVLTLSNEIGAADQRPALLITAGLDGRHRLGTETALRTARNLLEDHADLLEKMTVYIIPRVNPDGTELNFGPVNAGHSGNVTVVDADRDGVADEDGPNDLNGDGVITRMRRVDPALDDEATHMADPVEPRLLKKPDSAKGERAKYSLYIEGLDDDGDGLIAEDGPGMIDLDKNFMHRWPEFDVDSGAYQLSEPESHALATFVLDHKNIVVAITYGRHDTLVNPPDGKGKDISGRGPKNIDSGDVSLYKEISRIYKDITSQAKAPKVDGAGSFHAWLYAQRGIPSFATTVWGRPDAAKQSDDAPDNDAAPDDEEVADMEESDDASVAGSWTGVLEIPDMGEMDYTLDIEQQSDGSLSGSFSTSMFSVDVSGTSSEATGSLSLEGSIGEGQTISISGTVSGNSLSGSITGPDGNSTDLSATREGGPDDASKDDNASEQGGKSKGKDKPADADAAAWLKYSDEKREGAGFVEWQAFDHPTLGSVEIGGFVPGFKMNPPADELDDLAEKQTDFVVELMGRRPELSLQGPEVTKLAPGLYEVRFGIVNDGYLPTTTTMARKARSVLPTVVKLSVPVEQITAGDRVSRSWGIDGSGGRFVLHWILRIDDNSAVSIEISNQQLGNRTVIFTAK